MNIERFRIPFALAVALMVIVGLLTLMSLLDSSLPQTARAQGAIHYVTTDGNCGAGYEPCYDTVQGAVDAAATGDEIRVAAGTYMDINDYGGLAQVVYITKSLTIRGGYTNDDWDTPDSETNLTELNATVQGRVIVISGEVTITIEGLRLTYGSADGLGDGAGMYVQDATVTLSHVWVLSNTTSSGGGGGIYMQDSVATVVTCTIQGNTARNGSGLHFSGTDATVAGSTIKNNTVTSNLAEGIGIQIAGGSDVILSGNAIQYNTKTTGSPNVGAVYLPPFGNQATIKNNLIAGNSGKGIVVSFAQATIAGNTVLENSGTGISVEGGVAVIIGNIVDGNSLGVSAGADTLLEGNLIQNNSSGFRASGGGVYLGSGPITMTRNIVQDNVAGAPCGNGGGIFVAGNNITLHENVIRRNVAKSFSPLGYPEDGKGGGVYISGDATLINNIVTDNHAENIGAGIFIVGSSPDLYHNTIANNASGDGTGVYVVESGSDLAQPELYNTIIASHTVGVYASGGGLNVVRLDGVLWGNNISNTVGGGTFFIFNETQGDPAFVDPASYNYHIGPSSAAIDAGVDDAGITTDIDGQTRPHYGGYDLGADEAWAVVAVKTATPTAAGPDDVVTYTIVLTNTTTAPMTVRLTDTLPSQVDYTGPITYTGGSVGLPTRVVTWTGAVLTTTPTLITWPVRVVSDVTCGITIPNTATVRDAYGLFETEPALIMVPKGYHYIYLPLVLRGY
jgi:uncharacterized repeat protein (TIGR01451 family)